MQYYNGAGKQGDFLLIPELSDSGPPPPRPLPPRAGVIFLISISSLSLEGRGLARLRRVKVRVIDLLGFANAPRKAVSVCALE